MNCHNIYFRAEIRKKYLPDTRSYLEQCFIVSGSVQLVRYGLLKAFMKLAGPCLGSILRDPLDENPCIYSQKCSVITVSTWRNMDIDWLLGVTTRQPLWVILCRLPEKGRREIGEIAEEMKREGQGRKRKLNESGETKEIKTFPLCPTVFIANFNWGTRSYSIFFYWSSPVKINARFFFFFFFWDGAFIAVILLKMGDCWSCASLNNERCFDSKHRHTCIFAKICGHWVFEQPRPKKNVASFRKERSRPKKWGL